MARTQVPSGQVKNYSILIEDLRDFAPQDGGGLDLIVLAGRIRNDNTVTDKSQQTVSLTASQTNYVELNSSGVASANTTGFSSGSIPIAEIVTASGSISSISDKRTWISKLTYGARVTHNSAQSVSSGAFFDLSFNTVIFDGGNFHDSGDPDHLTIPEDGIYFVVGNIQWESGAGNDIRARFRIGGLRYAQVAKAATGDRQFQVSTLVKASKGDAVEFEVAQLSGSSKDVEVVSGISPTLAIAKVI